MDQQWILESNIDRRQVTFHEDFFNFSTLIQQMDIGDVVRVEIASPILELFKTFLERHNYSTDNFVVQTPLKSAKFVDNVDEITYEIFKDYAGVINIDRAKPLIEAAYYLGAEQIKKALQCAMICEFFCENTEAALAKFKQDFNVPELTPEEEYKIINNFPLIFEEVNNNIRMDLEKEEMKYKDLIQDQIQQGQQQQDQ